MAARGKLNSKYQGMNWITPKRRLAIYLRDGLACVYCGRGIEVEGLRLTLDHLEPHCSSATPDNTSENLITACVSCNSKRGALRLVKFCHSLLSTPAAGRLLAHIRAQVLRPLDLPRAQHLLESRGNFSTALATLKKLA